jgi:hypothetical protein
MLYGVGKALIEKGLLPTDLAQQVDRFTQEEKLSGLAALVRNILRVADKPNDKGEEKSQTFVNVLLLARKPYLAA